MDDVRLALLGDKAAQERMTELGELLSCAHCKGKGKVSYIKESLRKEMEDTP